MVLPDRGDATGLNISFKISVEDINYPIYASSATLTCFQCGAFGHLQSFCPKASSTRCGKTGHTDAGCKEEITSPLPVNIHNEKEVTVTPPSNIPNEEGTSGSTNNDITLSHETPVMDTELKSATSKRRAPDDSSGTVKKVVLDMETFTTNTIQVSAEIPSQNVEHINETDPLEKCNESQTVQECVHP